MCLYVKSDFLCKPDNQSVSQSFSVCLCLSVCMYVCMLCLETLLWSHNTHNIILFANEDRSTDWPTIWGSFILSACFQGKFFAFQQVDGANVYTTVRVFWVVNTSRVMRIFNYTTNCWHPEQIEPVGIHWSSRKTNNRKCTHLKSWVHSFYQVLRWALEASLPSWQPVTIFSEKRSHFPCVGLRERVS